MVINNVVPVFISFEYLHIHASKINNQLPQSRHSCWIMHDSPIVSTNI